MLPSSIHVLVPFWGLAGGVIKILDYAEHAAILGIPTVLWAPPLPDSDDPIHTLPVQNRLLVNPLVEVRLLDELVIDADDTVLFTEPTHHEQIERAAPGSLGPRLIHLIQGTRHANPRWQEGRNYRLLHRPMTRVAVSTQVAEAIAPVANTRYALHTVIEGHDWQYFASRPDQNSSVHAPLRVLYTTWKSDLGDRVATELASDDRVAFIPVRTTLGWPSLRNRYHGADVLLCTPGPEEGFYLPGLEAMGAGLAVVTALVGGNAAYIRDGHNALVVPYDDVAAHASAIIDLVNDPVRRAELVTNGRSTVEKHTIVEEREAFAAVLNSLCP